MTAKKAAELVAKLARVAAAGSGATESERTSAALEVCRLISTHNLMEPHLAVVSPRPRASTPAPSRQAAREHYSPPADYDPVRIMTEDHHVPWTAARDATCVAEGCGGPIFRNETVWRQLINGQELYAHADCWTPSEAT